ncbi:erythromycin esterase family protein [Streptomyces sp. NPDC059900]|uniref:erythromycin esterase family protein n=1 Tax=Streptomyces sp. NPDC059900 TaxID=3155816 RepID=UPI00341BAC05
MNHCRPANRPVSRRRLLGSATAVLAAGALGTGTAAASAPSAGEPIGALNRSALPLNDLDGLGRMIGDARVVGLGEASHSAHEFFVLKQRLFRHLVTTRGFTTFVLEASWSTGLRLDAYVTRGTGDPAQIMREEFQGQYVFWNTREYLDLIRWMRRYNTTHPDRPQLRFVGNDLGYAGPDAFERVTDYLTTHRPDLAGRMKDLYAELKPAAGTQSGPWMFTQLTKELSARQAEADRAVAALALLRDHGRPHVAGRDTQRAYTRALQNATAITQSFTGYAFPNEQFPERMRYRDRAMAANTAWWLRHEGGRILLASNNGHVAYTSDNPDEFPEPTGAFLRDRLGPDYVSIGLTFNQGTVNALPEPTAQQPLEYPVDPAPEGYNEHTLDKLRHRDFTIDMRTAPAAARAWLAAARPTRSYGLYWSSDDPETALGRSYDILIHLHQVQAAHLLG